MGMHHRLESTHKWESTTSTGSALLVGIYHLRDGTAPSMFAPSLAWTIGRCCHMWLSFIWLFLNISPMFTCSTAHWTWKVKYAWMTPPGGVCVFEDVLPSLEMDAWLCHPSVRGQGTEDSCHTHGISLTYPLPFNPILSSHLLTLLPPHNGKRV